MRESQFKSNLNKGSKFLSKLKIAYVKDENQNSKINNKTNSNNTDSSQSQKQKKIIRRFSGLTSPMSGLNKSQKKTETEVVSESNNDSFINKATLKEMVENASPEQKVLNLIEDTLELFNEKPVNSIYQPEKERYELIEKSVLEKIKKENAELKLLKIKKIEELNSIKEEFGKVKNDVNKLSNRFNNGEKDKTKNVNEIYQLQDNLNQLLISNQKVSAMIEKEKVEKDNLFRALIHFKKEHKGKLPEALKELYQKVNNESYTKSHDVKNEERIDSLKLRIENLQKTLKTKKTELIKKKEILSKGGIDKNNFNI